MGSGGDGADRTNDNNHVGGMRTKPLCQLQVRGVRVGLGDRRVARYERLYASR